MKTDEIISQLRIIMKQRNLDAWIINGTDPHCSEYVCPRWQSRMFVSSFTGSAGTIVITSDFAGIWVDSRYFIQCESQIKGTCLQMLRLDGPESSSPLKMLSSEKFSGMSVGIASDTLMLDVYRAYLKKGVNLIPCDDIIDAIWKDRPAVPNTPAYQLPLEICGLSCIEKLNLIREKCRINGESWNLVTNLDEIAWILNIRANDIEYTNTFVAFLLIGTDSCMLFTDKSRFTDPSCLPDCILLSQYECIHDVLKTITPDSGKVRLDPRTVNMRLADDLSKAQISEGEDYAVLMKACKNEAELRGMEKSHILDGVALVNLFADIKSGLYELSELSLADLLEQKKKRCPDYLGPSFSTIAGFASHGAIVHYSATPSTDVSLSGDGLLILDCGSQYRFGTTDVTRTLLFGKGTEEQKHDYTLVLKGHLSLSRQIFPEGTSGAQLDALAKQFMWQDQKTFYHGTGHGVGFCLNVHEGPQRISPKSFDVPLKEGMITSNEPGLYIENHYGIRIENLIQTVRHSHSDFGNFLCFKTLTCCPYERDLIDISMLTEEEKSQINTYHAWVRKTLCNLVDSCALNYLIKATEKI